MKQHCDRCGVVGTPSKPAGSNYWSLPDGWEKKLGHELCKNCLAALDRWLQTNQPTLDPEIVKAWSEASSITVCEGCSVGPAEGVDDDGLELCEGCLEAAAIQPPYCGDCDWAGKAEDLVVDDENVTHCPLCKSTAIRES